jgi:hypothetical protein
VSEIEGNGSIRNAYVEEAASYKGGDIASTAWAITLPSVVPSHVPSCIARNSAMLSGLRIAQRSDVPSAPRHAPSRAAG